MDTEELFELGTRLGLRGDDLEQWVLEEQRYWREEKELELESLKKIADMKKARAVIENERDEHSECTYDSVQINSTRHDGSVHQYGRACGNRAPNNITCEGKYLRLEFKSDGSVSYPGFTAVYRMGARGIEWFDTGLDSMKGSQIR
ncbi:hypothetical protein HPB48_004494 [Haemaphysalis longicornis]|uniref:CUB domain-containing protein n=1 Tax=Haemaphysalis longicornis TaxID=44386 RepID=A0A9J6GY12_HAELO|nr:hypothetical protein HPB48_004494 [Haemaphysalis longicornis]